ncbi:hypothetical protein ABQJ54_13610 [Rhodanobacter sp. Si-c]|uniref:Uncharacterized protein n=1 Tax=Rhodanobacter lycopersici TaxID=3162487 RepID=A0ABV3QG62_9GAMM
MENFERVANEIIAYINSNDCRLMEAITTHGSRFILFGASGSGKTRAIEFANKQLPPNQQITESNDMLFCKRVSDAKTIFDDKNLKYQGARHIGFSIVKREMAAKIHNERIKVFWLTR